MNRMGIERLQRSPNMHTDATLSGFQNHSGVLKYQYLESSHLCINMLFWNIWILFSPPPHSTATQLRIEAFPPPWGGGTNKT